MKILRRRNHDTGIMLLECVAYIAGLAVVMGLAYAAYYRSLSVSGDIRRNASDITKTLSCGERWREEIRGATGAIFVSGTDGNQVVRIPQASGDLIYRFENGVIQRSSDGKVFKDVLANVKTSEILRDERKHVIAWRWEIELKAVKKAKVTPLFTFEAVPTTK